MSWDINAYSKIINDDYGLDTADEISGFTCSHRDGIGQSEMTELFRDNAIEILSEKEYNIAFDTYVHTKEIILKVKEIGENLKAGESFNIFIKDILDSGHDKIYIDAF